LHAALDAYDGALKHPDLESSLRRDAQHNRDLVARQLQTQKDQKSPSSGGQSTSKDQQNGKPQGSDAKDAPSASDSSKPPATAASESPSQGEKSKPAGSEPSATTPTSPSQKSPSQKSPGDRQRPADQRPQSTDDRNASTQHQPQEQAVGQQAPGSASRGDEKQLTSRGAAIGDSSLPRTEQQLALEQWLRQIPDDPGGLLRRKFMIEHLMKQQQVQP
jgi:Ca-activated chloride channel family protein